jgi:CheY-like chemotaxis protein
MDGPADTGSQRDAGDETPKGVFDIDEILGQVSDALERTAQQKGLEFVLHRSRDVPARLVGDAQRLGHVLMHLTANAVRYTASGEVAVTVERESIDERRREIVLRVSVSDTGIGVDDTIVALFQPFRRDRAPAPGGGGRGLVVIREAVRSMGGAMEVATAPGVGSDFSFTARFGIAARAAEAAPRFGGLHALVVDDNDTARAALQQLLEATGCRVTAASDGAEAIEAMRTAAVPIRLAIVDSSMPGVDTLETMHRLCSGTGHPPVIALVTRFNREEVMAHAGRLQLPIAAYLLKPVKAGDLYRAVADAGANARSAVNEPVRLLDARGALERLGGSPQLLERMLCEFSEAQAGTAQEVRALIESGRLEEASRRVHVAKGTAMVLGLERFSAVATPLEKALHQGDGAAGLALLASFADELAAAIGACNRARSEQARANGPDRARVPAARSATAVRAVLQRLVVLLERNSMAAVEVAQELDELLPGAADGIKASLYKLDFAAARRALERLTEDFAASRD